MAREEAADGKARNRRTGLVASILVRMRAVLRSGFAGFGGVRAERRMELIETLQLGGKRQLLLVSCDGQRYLVGAGGDSVHSIAAIEQDLTTQSALPELRGNSTSHRSAVAIQATGQEMRCY